MTDSADDTWTSPSPPPQPQADTAPQTLADRYRLRERLAVGGMATVWRATDDVLAREVAVKVLHEHLAADEGFRERFRREAVSAAKLTHPNIVGLYDTGRDGEHTFLVMELVEGSTLKDRFADGPLPVGQVARIGVQVARALAYAHARGLVHRDVKPANILIAHDGTVKVTDFGIAKADQSEDLTSTGTVLGTAAYVSPEQIRGEPVDGAADQYGLGVVLYEALAGEQPFRAGSPLLTAAQRLEHDPRPVRSVRPEVPRGLETALQRAMAREPGERYPDLSAFGDALAEHADAEADVDLAEPAEPAAPATAERAEPVSAPDEDSAPPRRRRVARWGAVAALLVAAVLGWAAVGGTDVAEQLPFLDSTSEADPVAPQAIQVLDPGGSGGENDADVGNLVDGDEDTTWRTEHYESPAFGGLKSGVGVVIDLGEPMFVEQVVGRSVLESVDVELRAAEAIEPEPSDWRELDEVSDGSDLIQLAPDQPVQTRYLLVWIHGELPPSPYSAGRYTAEFSELTVTARPQES